MTQNPLDGMQGNTLSQNHTQTHGTKVCKLTCLRSVTSDSFQLGVEFASSGQSHSAHFSSEK